MASHAPTLRSLYRQLLRELPLPSPTSAIRNSRSKPSILSHPSPLKTRIRSSFSTMSESTNAQAKIQEAEQFVQYLKAQRTYTTLVDRYNPGANLDEEERVRLTARRVGMDLPVEFEVKPFGDGKE